MYSYGAELLPVELFRAATVSAVCGFDVVGEIDKLRRGGFFGGVGCKYAINDVVIHSISSIKCIITHRYF